MSKGLVSLANSRPPCTRSECNCNP